MASQSFGGIDVVVDETLKIYPVHEVEYLDKLVWLCVQLSHDLQQFLHLITFSQFACLQHECHNGLLLDTEYHGRLLLQLEVHIVDAGLRVHS